jgi:predicted Zn-dependent protease with MMP-like domain
MDEERFERLVDEAMAELPEEFIDSLENLEIVVKEWPSAEELREAGLDPHSRAGLLGLYRGVPLTERGAHYAWVAPDIITLYQGPIERAAGRSDEAVRRQVRLTLMHEIGHYFGIDEDRLEELGWA